MIPGDFLDGFNMIMDIECPSRQSVRVMVNRAQTRYSDSERDTETNTIRRTGILNVEFLCVGNPIYEASFSYAHLGGDELCKIILRTNPFSDNRNTFEHAKLFSYSYESVDNACEIHKIQMGWVFQNQVATIRPPIELRTDCRTTRDVPSGPTNWKYEGF